MEWIRLGVTMSKLCWSPTQRSWYGVSRLVMLMGSLAMGTVGNTSNTFGKKEAIKGIGKHTNLEFHGLLKHVGNMLTSPNLKNGLGDMRCNGKQGFNNSLAR